MVATEVCCTTQVQYKRFHRTAARWSLLSRKKVQDSKRATPKKWEKWYLPEDVDDARHQGLLWGAPNTKEQHQLLNGDHIIEEEKEGEKRGEGAASGITFRGCQFNCVSGHVINSTEGGRRHGYQARTYRRTFI